MVISVIGCYVVSVRRSRAGGSACHELTGSALACRFAVAAVSPSALVSERGTRVRPHADNDRSGHSHIASRESLTSAGSTHVRSGEGVSRQQMTGDHHPVRGTERAPSTLTTCSERGAGMNSHLLSLGSGVAARRQTTSGLRARVRACSWSWSSTYRRADPRIRSTPRVGGLSDRRSRERESVLSPPGAISRVLSALTRNDTQRHDRAQSDTDGGSDRVSRSSGRRWMARDPCSDRPTQCRIATGRTPRRCDSSGSPVQPRPRRMASARAALTSRDAAEALGEGSTISNMHPLTLAGQSIEAVGLVATIVGLYRTWQEFGDPDVSLWEPVTRRLRARAESLWRGARAVWARLLRRRHDVVVHALAGTIQFSGSLSARARVTWGPLPKGKTADQLREIDGGYR